MLSGCSDFNVNSFSRRCESPSRVAASVPARARRSACSRSPAFARPEEKSAVVVLGLYDKWQGADPYVLVQSELEVRDGLVVAAESGREKGEGSCYRAAEGGGKGEHGEMSGCGQ